MGHPTEKRVCLALIAVVCTPNARPCPKRGPQQLPVATLEPPPGAGQTQKATLSPLINYDLSKKFPKEGASVLSRGPRRNREDAKRLQPFLGLASLRLVGTFQAELWIQAGPWKPGMRATVTARACSSWQGQPRPVGR